MSTPNTGSRRLTTDTAHAPPDPLRQDAAEIDLRASNQPAQGYADKLPSTNLHLPRSPLIGREHEVATVQRLLLQNEVGLLTLTGPGGIGKTRLAMQVAANLLDHFVNGIYFVSLAPITDSTLVIPAIAQALDLRDAGTRALLESLKDFLRDRQLLLVLDNFEQVVGAAPLVAALLVECPRLKLLVTSRATLHLYGEQEFPVPPLALPDRTRLTAMGVDLAQVASVALFVQRAVAVKPDFALTATNAAVVAEICISLDGLPLAIELAAGKIKLFSPPALLARLQQRLTLLTGGPHDLPARQRTLRAEIDWSYNLLAPGDRALFRRLAVFAGGFTLEAGQAVGPSGHPAPGAPSTGSGQVLGGNVLDGIASLVDQNLLQQRDGPDGEPRLWMLETIREYGLEQLTASGEIETVHRQHADFFLTLAEVTEPTLLGAQRERGLARLEVELDNFRAALVWSQTLPLQDDASRPDVGLRLAGALTWFAHFGNHVNEARGWLLAVLQRAAAARGFPGHSATVVQAKALWGAGLMAVIQGDYQIARAQLEESVALWRTLGDPCGLAAALRELGYVALFQGHLLAAHRYTVESITLFRGAGNRWELALALHNLGATLTKQGDYTKALASFEECLSLYRDLNDAWGVSTALAGLGFVCGQRGDYTTARVRLEEALAIWRAKEDKWSKTEALTLLGEVIQRQGEPKQASDVYLECLVLTREVGGKAHSALVLRHLGSVAQSLRQYDRAVRLFAAAAIWDTASGDIFKTLVDHAEHERELAAVRAAIGEEAFSTNWAAGQALTLDQAIEYVLVVAEASEPAPPRVEHNPVVSFPSAYSAGLTAREVEVLRLLALDHSYAQIAERLVISRRTVNAHLTSIYSKLGVTSRAEATRFALDHRLA